MHFPRMGLLPAGGKGMVRLRPLIAPPLASGPGLPGAPPHRGRDSQIMQKRPPTFMNNQSGAMAVMVALALLVILSAAALAVDIGYIARVRVELQKTADAGALAGANVLGLSATPDWSAAQAASISIVQQNKAEGQLLADCQVNYGYWSLTAKTLPLKSSGSTPTSTDAKAIQVEVAKKDGHNGGPLKMLFAPIFGVNTWPVTARAVAIVKQSGSSPFDYTIFSGSPSHNLILNGSQTVKGSAHANHKLLINGSSNISGAAEGVNNVTVNGSNTIGSVVANTVEQITVNGSNTIGSQSGGAGNITMPDYSQQIASTAAQVYDSNQIFNGAVDVSGSIYVNGNVTLNGSISSTGAILATGNIIVNGSSSISGSNQVCIYSQNGNITFNGSSFSGNESSEIIYAPNGTVTINGSFTFHGRIIANKVIINGSDNINGGDYPVTTLPITSRGAVLVQ